MHVGWMQDLAIFMFGLDIDGMLPHYTCPFVSCLLGILFVVTLQHQIHLLLCACHTADSVGVHCPGMCS